MDSVKSCDKRKRDDIKTKKAGRYGPPFGCVFYRSTPMSIAIVNAEEVAFVMFFGDTQSPSM